MSDGDSARFVGSRCLRDERRSFGGGKDDITWSSREKGCEYGEEEEGEQQSAAERGLTHD